MKTEAGLLSPHLNSDDNPSAKATSSCLLSVLLSLVKEKKKITNQLNKISVLLHAPSPITFLFPLRELKLAQNFFSFRNLSHAPSRCYSRIKTTDSDASILLLPLTRGHYGPESSFSTLLLWGCCQGHSLKASVGTRIATICPTLECHQST